PLGTSLLGPKNWGYVLRIDSVDPPVPVEHQPMTVHYTLWNGTPTAVQGAVSGDGGPPWDGDIPAYSYIEQSFTAVAPAARQGLPVGVNFYKIPSSLLTDVPAPDAHAEVAVDVAAQYVVSLDSFTIHTTRALNNDTDYVGTSLQVGQTDAVSL